MKWVYVKTLIVESLAVCSAIPRHLNISPGDILRLPVSSFYCETLMVPDFYYDKCIFILQSNMTVNYTFSIIDINLNAERSALTFGHGDVVNSQSRLFDATRSSPMNWFSVVKTNAWIVYHRVCQFYSGGIELNLNIEATSNGKDCNLS